MSATTKRRTCLPLAAALSLIATAPRTANGLESLPVLAVDPLAQLAEVENHTQVLARWISGGRTGEVLLLVDASARAFPLPGGRKALEGIRGALVAPAPVESPAGIPAVETGFTRAVIALGIAREVYWIIPHEGFRGPALREALRETGLSDEERRSFAERDGCLRGIVEGAPFSVCALGDLPRIAEPVLLGIDAGFILTAAAEKQGNPLAEGRRLLTILAERRLTVRDAFVYAPTEPRLPSPLSPDLRWVGETLAQALREPALTSSPEPPRRWSALQSLALLLDLKQYPYLLHETLPLLTVHEDDPALQLYAAQALAGMGRVEEALERAETACRLNRGYCSGLPWIGLARFADGDIDGGERYFVAGTRLRPAMRFGQLARGLWLKGAGRGGAALTVFQDLSAAGEVFPAAFLAGAIQASAGDRAGARRQYDRGVEALRLDPYLRVVDPDTAQAVRDAAALYREEGQAGVAELLESDPRLRLAPAEPAPSDP